MYKKKEEKMPINIKNSSHKRWHAIRSLPFRFFLSHSLSFHQAGFRRQFKRQVFHFVSVRWSFSGLFYFAVVSPSQFFFLLMHLKQVQNHRLLPISTLKAIDLILTMIQKRPTYIARRAFLLCLFFCSYLVDGIN